MTTLEIRDLSLRVGSTPILDGIRWTLRGPGIFTLLGPSGVGKSTLLRATQRLIDHGHGGWRRKGELLLDGESIFAPGQSKQELARRIGFVQQRPRMLAGSIRANVEFALRHTTRMSRAEIRERAEEAIARVGLREEVPSLEQAAWRLSGGQAQRLAIARAIALEPEVLLMDEPISSLDTASADRVEEVIQSISRGCLVVVVTHKVGLAVRVPDAAGYLLRAERGARLIEVGPAPEIFESPSSERAREFVRQGYGRIGDEARRRSAGRRSSPRSRTAEESTGETIGLPASLHRFYLFVCGRNETRSPLAEAICASEIGRRLGRSAGEDPRSVRAESAGLSVSAGQPMSAAARSTLDGIGVAAHDHRSRAVSVDLMLEADRVFCMTEDQKRELWSRFPAMRHKVRRLDPISDIEEPVGDDPAALRHVAGRIGDSVRWRMSRDLGAEGSRG